RGWSCRGSSGGASSMSIYSDAIRPDSIGVRDASCRPTSPSCSKRRRKMPSFPEPAWFQALGRLMETEGPLFQRLGYAETRFVIRVLPDGDNNGGAQQVGIVIDGFRLIEAAPVSDLGTFDADFVICGKRAVWDRMLEEIAHDGRPSLRHTLSSLALLG